MIFQDLGIHDILVALMKWEEKKTFHSFLESNLIYTSVIQNQRPSQNQREEEDQFSNSFGTFKKYRTLAN